MTRKASTPVGHTGTVRPARTTRPAQPAPARSPRQVGIRPWHLLLLGALAATAAGALLTRDGGTVRTVAVMTVLLSASLVAAAAARTLRPLVTDDAGEQTDMVGGRTKAALEREKMLVLRSIKEVEFDRAMRKISEADYAEIVPRLRTRALGLIRQLEGSSGYRAQIERDIAALLTAQLRETLDPVAADAGRGRAGLPRPGSCPNCSTGNDRDARFCKSCGARLAEDV